jgi:hypothetical protein
MLLLFGVIVLPCIASGTPRALYRRRPCKLTLIRGGLRCLPGYYCSSLVTLGYTSGRRKSAQDGHMAPNSDGRSGPIHSIFVPLRSSGRIGCHSPTTSRTPIHPEILCHRFASRCSSRF